MADRTDQTDRAASHSLWKCLGLALGLVMVAANSRGAQRMTSWQHALQIIEGTRPLTFPRRERLPFIVWGLQNLKAEGNGDLEQVLKDLDARGIATVTSWRYASRKTNLPEALERARVLHRLGLPVVVNSTGVLQRFCNGNPDTAHIDAEGKPFFDLSHAVNVKIGCPSEWA